MAQEQVGCDLLRKRLDRDFPLRPVRLDETWVVFDAELDRAREIADRALVPGGQVGEVRRRQVARREVEAAVERVRDLVPSREETPAHVSARP